MKTAWVLATSLLSALHAAVIQDLIYVNETGTAFYITSSETDCKNLKNVGKAYRCDLTVDQSGGVTTVTFPVALARTYGANLGTIVVNEPGKNAGQSDVIQFVGDLVDPNNRTLATSIKFYSLGDDADTDKSTDTPAASFPKVTADGPCGTTFPAGKICSAVEDSLNFDAGNDYVNGSQIVFDGKTPYPQKKKNTPDITLPSLIGASGFAFTVSGQNQIGSAPNYPNTFIRYIFVSDTDPEPKASTPEPRATILIGIALVVCGATKRRWKNSGS